MSDFIESMFPKKDKGLESTRKLIEYTQEINDLVLKGEGTVSTYKKLMVAELKELKEAIDEKDKLGFVKELMDCIVVGSYLHYLLTGNTYGTSMTTNMEGLERYFELWDIEKYVTCFLPECITTFCALDIDHEFAVDQMISESQSKFPMFSDDVDWDSWGTLNKSGCDYFVEELEGERYGGVTYEILPNNRVVFWCTTEYGTPVRKYLKPGTFKAADLSTVVKHFR